jgi:hypothetical protein
MLEGFFGDFAADTKDGHIDENQVVVAGRARGGPRPKLDCWRRLGDRTA